MLKTILKSIGIFILTFFFLSVLKCYNQTVTPKLQFFLLLKREFIDINSHIIPVLIASILLNANLLSAFKGIIYKLHGSMGQISLKSIKNSSLLPINNSIDNTINTYKLITGEWKDLFWEYEIYKLDMLSSEINGKPEVANKIRTNRRLRITDLAVRLINFFTFQFKTTETNLKKLIENNLIDNDEYFRNQQIRKIMPWTTSQRLLIISKNDILDLIHNHNGDLGKFIDWHLFEGEYSSFRKKYGFSLWGKHFIIKRINLKILVHTIEGFITPAQLINTCNYHNLLSIDFAYSNSLFKYKNLYAQKDDKVILYSSCNGDNREMVKNYHAWFKELWEKSNENTFDSTLYSVSKNISTKECFKSFLTSIDTRRLKQ